jgi:hypothetical protein
MHPFPWDEALQSTRKHAACTKAMRTEDLDFWTDEIKMIPRIMAFLNSQNGPNNP